jgi:hypothetical protein
MSDKCIQVTKDGYMENAVLTESFTIPLTSGSLSETDATYLFEINVAIHSLATSISYGGKYFVAVRRASSTSSIRSGATGVIDWSDGITVLNVSISGNNLVVQVDQTTGATGYTNNTRYWRAFVTAYVKDDTV